MPMIWGTVMNINPKVRVVQGRSSAQPFAKDFLCKTKIMTILKSRMKSATASEIYIDGFCTRATSLLIKLHISFEMPVKRPPAFLLIYYQSHLVLFDSPQYETNHYLYCEELEIAVRCLFSGLHWQRGTWGILNIPTNGQGVEEQLP